MEGMDMDEMRKEVEKASEKVILEQNELKGRFLRAKMALKQGDLLFSEPFLASTCLFSFTFISIISSCC